MSSIINVLNNTFSITAVEGLVKLANLKRDMENVERGVRDAWAAKRSMLKEQWTEEI